jgi:hypothetical protein
MPASPPVPAALALRQAMERRDATAALEAFAEDAGVRSPVTARLAFEGRAQIELLLEALFEVFEDIRYSAHADGERSAFLVGGARVGSLSVQWADHIELDEGGRIREFTVFFRPLPATALALQRLGGRLAARGGRARGALVSTLTLPLALLTRAGDGLGARLVAPAIKRRR